jgi:hypothetical protein
MKLELLAILASICLCCSPACGQVASGTVIVFQLTKNEFVIAADSRALFSNKPPDDTQCKIASLDSHFVIGVDGAASYIPGEADLIRPSWNAIEVAKRIAGLYAPAPSQGPEATVMAIADLWARELKNNWGILYSAYPERVKEAAKMSNDSALTNGLFAFAQNGEIAFTVRTIVVGDLGIQVSTPFLPDCTAKPCASGQIDIAMEFLKATSERAKKEQAKQAHANSKSGTLESDMARAVRLVDLTIAYDKTGTVGGPVDGLELLSNGSVRWYRRKKNCPGN